MRNSRFLLVGVLLLTVSSLLFAGGQAAREATSTRRNTLYVAGLQWGPPSNFNPINPNPAWPNNANNVRILIYETLFMFNMLDGALEPLIGRSKRWVDPLTLEVSLNPAARFNDGRRVTADDVVYSFDLARRYTIRWSMYWRHLAEVVARGPETVIFRMRSDNPNRLFILDSMQDVPVLPKHVWERIEAENNNDLAAIQRFVNDNPVGSGPYRIHSFSDTRILLIRDENYWGRALFGRLPAPQFIMHPIFKSNDVGNLAFQEDQVDISQQFIPQVWRMWEDGSPIRTYLPESPFYLPGNIPSLIVNVTRRGLDNPDVRRALAMAIDYERIANVAMSGYSRDLRPATVLPHEFRFIDEAALRPLQWRTDVDAANRLLDSIGATRDRHGIRTLPDGTRLGPWRVQAPHGWTDWNAAIEIVVENGRRVGIELQPYFPDMPVWVNDRQLGNFDLIMHNPAGGLRPSQPFGRSRNIMYSRGVPPIGEVAFWNEGRYRNARADEIIDRIPLTDDMAELRRLYTELNMIFLRDIPLIPLMYRPWLFYTFNESAWTGFPRQGDNTNIPPQILSDGAGIRGLYVIAPR